MPGNILATLAKVRIAILKKKQISEFNPTMITKRTTNVRVLDPLYPLQQKIKIYEAKLALSIGLTLAGPFLNIYSLVKG